MRWHGPLMLLYLLACLAPRQAPADIDPAEYEVKTAVRSAKESKKMKDEFQVDKQREEELQRQEDEREALRLAAEQAAWEAQPYPLRLTRMRCAVCHGADVYESQRHNRIGWQLVVLRMEFLDKALLDAAERSLITAHLAHTYPATGAVALREGLQQLAVVLFPLGLWITWKTVRSRAPNRKPSESEQHGTNHTPARQYKKRGGED